MKLTISTIDATIEDAPWDLSSFLLELQHTGGAFFILAASETDFLQGAVCGRDGYDLEYFESGIDGHYSSKKTVPTSVASQIVNAYRSSAEKWTDHCEWDYHEPLEESVDGSIGRFEGVALRHVLRELERHEIPCRLEQCKEGFEAFVSLENRVRALERVRSLFR